MKDVTGRPLKVGDKVAAIIPHARFLEVCVVEKLNPTGATVKNPRGRTTHRPSELLCFVTSEDTELLDLMQKVSDDEATSKGYDLYDVRKYLKERLEAYIKETSKKVSDGS